MEYFQNFFKAFWKSSLDDLPFSRVNHNFLSLQVSCSLALPRLQVQSSSQLHSFTSASLHVALLVRLHVVLHDCAQTLLQLNHHASAQPPCFLVYSVFSLPSCLQDHTSNLGDPPIEGTSLSTYTCRLRGLSFPTSQGRDIHKSSFMEYFQNFFKAFWKSSLDDLPFSRVNHSLLSLQVSCSLALRRLQVQSSSQLHSFTSCSTSCTTSCSTSRLVHGHLEEMFFFSFQNSVVTALTHIPKPDFKSLRISCRSNLQQEP
ncbi:hypothetical protein DY000_02021401 [Brassica cretica]|uniref:Uncharacterized protein n=1 Tax=Brassica cretica TaxID=69181 RepID=A0ABQ7EIR1_BRACR|nr:hypothetical protein DY000_02021401 [Brassica cretica]